MGRALERRRFEFLPRLAASLAARSDEAPADPPRALLLGDGDGRFLCALLAACPTLRVDYVESSAQMLALAKARTVRRFGGEGAGQVRFFQADARSWPLPEEPVYTFVSTHFFLDCLTDTEVGQLLTRLERSLRPDATWIVSEFAQPARGLPAWRARLWIGGLYRLFGWFTGLKVRCLPDHPAIFKTHGWNLQRRVDADWGLLASEWWERLPGGFNV